MRVRRVAVWWSRWGGALRAEVEAVAAQRFGLNVYSLSRASMMDHRVLGGH